MDTKEHLIEAGFSNEIDWQESLSLDDLSETVFLREAAWVILSAGFKESVLRQLFLRLSEIFFYWEASERILGSAEDCREMALEVFANHRKIDAIIQLSGIVHNFGIEYVRNNVRNLGAAFLQTLPHIGPITSWHLAKNIGMNVVKPDRHLMRIASASGYSSAEHMCSVISDVTGDSLSVIDIVIWRYAAISGSGQLNL